MTGQHSGVEEIVAAMFAEEFLSGGVDYDTLERLHRGDVREWLDVLRDSGLLDVHTITDLGEQWRCNPRLLLDLMLREADQMTGRRCSVSWAALDRLAPLAQFG